MPAASITLQAIALRYPLLQCTAAGRERSSSVRVGHQRIQRMQFGAYDVPALPFRRTAHVDDRNSPLASRKSCTVICRIIASGSPAAAQPAIPPSTAPSHALDPHARQAHARLFGGLHVFGDQNQFAVEPQQRAGP